MRNNKIQKLVSLFYEVGTLRRVPRAHQQTLLAEDRSDNIASHSFRVAFIGYFLAKESGADADKTLKMCLLHDLEEVRANDHNWVHKKYVKVFDEEIRQEQLSGLIGSDELLDLSKEYGERKTLEAQIAKDADLLDELFLLREYEWGGNKEAAGWLKHEMGDKNQQEKLMKTETAKILAEEIKKQEPGFWWKNLWTSQRRV